MIRANNGNLANIDDFFPVGRVGGNMFIYVNMTFEVILRSPIVLR